MRRWLLELRAAWRNESIVLSSPMPIEVVRRWLAGGRINRGGDVVWRTAAKMNTRASWRPVLRGRLRPAESGSTFIGVLGWDPVLKVFTCCLLGAFTGMLITSMTVGVVLVFNGGWRPAGEAFSVAAFGLLGVCTGIVSVLVGYRETRAQTSYLRSWITGSMNARWYQNRQDFGN